jgi:hypothetical protein
MGTSYWCDKTPDTISIYFNIIMEKLEITINKENTITSEELRVFIRQFNLLRNEEVKRQIINLVENFDKS